MISLVITHNIRSTTRALVSLRRELQNPQDGLERVKKKQISRWTKNFRNQGSEYGTWAALAESTIAGRRARGQPAGPILQASGALLNVFNTENQAGIIAAQSIHWQFHGVSGGAGGATGPFHGEGFYNVPAGGVWVPPRVIWDLDQEDEENAEREMLKHIDRVIARYFP